MAKRAIHWFRVDLRVSDNNALAKASAESRRGVIGVFLLAPQMWRRHDESPVKIDFVLRTLRALREDLARINIPLLIRSAPTPEDAAPALLALANQYECDALYFNEQYEINEICRDEVVSGAFEETGRRVHTCTDQTIFDPASTRTGSGEFYSVFSPFKRKMIARLEEQGIPDLAPTPKEQDLIAVDAGEIPDVIDGFASPIDPALWPAGESHAQDTLQEFADDAMGRYAEQRDLPAVAGTSRLSPHLTIGAISGRQCLHAAIDASGGSIPADKDGASVWFSEILWREFYRHVLVGYPRVSMNRPFKLNTEDLTWRDDADGFEMWKAGRTGYPIVDAAMRQLRLTGWMHNRLRMISAMFLTKHLLIDWRKGERHFMRSLIDGDLASNNGGWQWSASTGVDAAPYFRIFNPYSQSRRFDTSGEFIRRYVPELRDVEGDAIHDPSGLNPLTRQSIDYPVPIVEHPYARKRAIDEFKRLGTKRAAGV